MNDYTSLLALALQAVNARMILIIALFMSFGLFCWAMYMGTFLALGTAAVFASFVFLPILFKGDGHVRKEEV